MKKILCAAVIAVFLNASAFEISHLNLDTNKFLINDTVGGITLTNVPGTNVASISSNGLMSSNQSQALLSAVKTNESRIVNLGSNLNVAGITQVSSINVGGTLSGSFGNWVLGSDGSGQVGNGAINWQSASGQFTVGSFISDNGDISTSGSGILSADVFLGDGSQLTGVLTAPYTITFSGGVTGSGTTNIALTVTNVGSSPLPAAQITGSIAATQITNAHLSLLVAGTNVTFQTNNSTRAVTINASSSGSSSNQNITLTGDATGSGATNIALTLATVATPGTSAKVTYNAKGLVTSGTTLSSGDIPNLPASIITSGNISTAAISNALTALLAQGGNITITYANGTNTFAVTGTLTNNTTGSAASATNVIAGVISNSTIYSTIGSGSNLLAAIPGKTYSLSNDFGLYTQAGGYVNMWPGYSLNFSNGIQLEIIGFIGGNANGSGGNSTHAVVTPNNAIILTGATNMFTSPNIFTLLDDNGNFQSAIDGGGQILAVASELQGFWLMDTSQSGGAITNSMYWGYGNDPDGNRSLQINNGFAHNSGVMTIATRAAFNSLNIRQNGDISAYNGSFNAEGKNFNSAGGAANITQGNFNSITMTNGAVANGIVTVNASGVFSSTSTPTFSGANITGLPVFNQGSTNVSAATSFTATFTTAFSDTNYTALSIGNGLALASQSVSSKTTTNCVFNMGIATGIVDWIAIHNK